MEILDRIKKLRDAYELTSRAFALRCGLKQNTFSYQMNGMRGLSLETIIAILNSFPEVSAEWLLRGQGKMYITDIAIDNTNRLLSCLESFAELREILEEESARIYGLVDEVNRLKKLK